MAQSKFHSALIFPAALAGGMSFCAFGYQQCLALALFDASGEFILSQALSLAAFLLGMGAVALWVEKRGTAAWARLAGVEFALCIFGAVSPYAVALIEFSLRYWGIEPAGKWILSIAPFYAFGLGGLVGFEIPALILLNPRLRSGFILSWNYFGGLCAAASVTLFLLPKLDLQRTALALALLNLTLAVATIWLKAARLTLKLASLGLALLMLGFGKMEPSLRNLYLKTIYMPVSHSEGGSLFKALQIYNQVEAPVRIRSAYQWIDIVNRDIAYNLWGENAFILYLDRRLQFSSANNHRYHQSMAQGGVSLLGRVPRRVLVLGGGDGLLIPELLRHPVESIDLVELDTEMLRLARELPALRRLNQNAFTHEKVHVHLGDAFSYIRRSDKTYDLILIDLPFPANYDLSPLYSREFYAFVKKRLVDDGLMVLDFPMPEDEGVTEGFGMLVRSLAAAGFEQPFVYGPEEFFVAAAADARPLAFDYKFLERWVDDSAVANLRSLPGQLEGARELNSKDTNSVFFPRLFSERTHPMPSRIGVDQPSPEFVALLLKRFERFRKEQRLDAGALSAPFLAQMHEWASILPSITRLGPNAWPKLQYFFEEGEGGQIHWGLEFADFEQPETLRELWRRHFPRAPRGQWVAVQIGSDGRKVRYGYPSAHDGLEWVDGKTADSSAAGVRRNFSGWQVALPPDSALNRLQLAIKSRFGFFARSHEEGHNKVRLYYP